MGEGSPDVAAWPPVPATASAENPKASVLAEVAERFVAAIATGAYPLMQPPTDAVRGPRARAPRRSEVIRRRAAAAPSATPAATKPGPQIRPHQLLDACARSPIVRERYKALVDASIDHVADLAETDQALGSVRSDLDTRSIGTMLLAVVIGSQTMAELGVVVEPAALARTLIAMLTVRRDPPGR
jgi:TetR/AcrR family transcriptional regulator, transcriptional repressor for nem operon